MRITFVPIAVLAALALALPATASAGLGAPTHDEAVQAGRDAYLYGFPLLDFLRIRATNTSVKAPDNKGNAPLNSFASASRFANPTDRTVVAPNVDTLYSIAQVDLGKGPVVLSHPDMGKRYFVFELVEPFTNVVGYIGARTTGSKAGRFALTWTGRKNAKPPKGVRTFKSPYRRLWVIGRTLISETKADFAAGRKLQKRYSLVPLNRLANPPKPPSGSPGKLVKAELPTGLAFFDALGDALKENPPPSRDKPLLDRLARFGIGIGKHPTESGLGQDVLDGLAEGYTAASTDLKNNTKLQFLNDAKKTDGWFTPPSKIGDYGTDYLFRAQIALVGIGANTPEEATYPGGLADGEGNLLRRDEEVHADLREGPGPAQRGVLVADDVRPRRLPGVQPRQALRDRTVPPALRDTQGRLDRRRDPARQADRDRRQLAAHARERELPPQPADLRAQAVGAERQLASAAGQARRIAGRLSRTPSSPS